jgi:hypothetical protein
MSPDGKLSRRRRRPGVGSGLRSPCKARLPTERALLNRRSLISGRRPAKNGEAMDGSPFVKQPRRLHDTGSPELAPSQFMPLERFQRK